jgi:hypothetical protein
MKPHKQTVYLPVKVEDGRTPEFYRDRLFLLKEEIKDVGNYFGDGVFYSQVETKTTQEITHWLKHQEGYFFTPEQINEYTQSVIKQALETAAKKADTEEKHGWMFVNKQSITNTFEETFKKFEV